MKSGLPLCLAVLSFCGLPAVAAPLPPHPVVVFTGHASDNGAQGISMTVLFKLEGPFSEPWTAPGMADFTIAAGTESLIAGRIEFTSLQMAQSVFVPVTYSQLASENGVSVNTSNLVNLSTSGSSILPRIQKRTLTVTGGTVNEGSAGGQQQAVFQVAIEKAINEPVTFTYASSGGTATAGQDYTPVFGTGTIPAGSLSTNIQVAVKGDAVAEADETTGLEITDISVPVLRGTDTTAIIQNDDAVEAPSPATALVTETSVAGDTAKAWFSVNHAQARTVPVVCRVSTRDGSAKAGSDYRALAPTNITFAAGETQKWVAITVTATAEAEAREEFFLDVEEMESHIVKSATCTIERFAITGISPNPTESGVYRIAFPAGLGQRYVIEESAAMSGTWSTASNLFTGTGEPQVQNVYPYTPRGFFRLRAFPPVDPGTPAAGS